MNEEQINKRLNKGAYGILFYRFWDERLFSLHGEAIEIWFN